MGATGNIYGWLRTPVGGYGQHLWVATDTCGWLRTSVGGYGQHLWGAKCRTYGWLRTSDF